MKEVKANLRGRRHSIENYGQGNNSRETSPCLEKFAFLCLNMFSFTVKLKNENYIEILTKPWRNKLLFELKKWYPGTAEETADQT